MKAKSVPKVMLEVVKPEAEDQPAGRNDPRGALAPAPLQIRRILVPVDFSACAINALHYAAGFAEALGGSLILLHVVEPVAGGEHYAVAPPTVDQTSEHLLESGRDRLAAVCQKLIGTRVPTETLARIGHAPSEIADTAKALGADLIVMGTHGHSGAAQVSLGGTAERVVHHAPCPVLTVRHSEE